jgi:hypothetical protein
VNLVLSTVPEVRESAYVSAEQEGRTGVPPLLGVLLPDPGVLLLPELGPLEGTLVLGFPELELVFGPLEGPLFVPAFGPLEGLLGPLEGLLFGPLFPGVDGVFPLLLLGLVGLEGGVVVAGGSPGTPRPLSDESNNCSRDRLATTRGQKRGRAATWPFLEYKQTTEGLLSQKEKPHPMWVFWSLTNW